MPHIAILVHEQDDCPDSYVLGQLAGLWREQGLDVRVVRPSEGLVKSDVAFLHVDLTVIPSEYLSWARQYSRLVNGAVTNISKRLISENLVRKRDAYTGAVLVKTNANSGGLREAALISERFSLGKRLLQTTDRLPWSCRPFLRSVDYRIFERTSQVPLGVWVNPKLVVERFRPEQKDGHYCLRSWVFLGDKDRGAIFYSKSPVVKARNIIHHDRLLEVPDTLRHIRKNLGFEFGKFDYTINEGEVVLLDVNRTPALGRMSREDCLPMLEELSQGIRMYL